MTDFKNKTRFEGVQCLRETPKAILVRIEGQDRWCPKSCIDDESEVYGEGHEGELVVNEWWAEKEGL